MKAPTLGLHMNFFSFEIFYAKVPFLIKMLVSQSQVKIHTGHDCARMNQQCKSLTYNTIMWF